MPSCLDDTTLTGLVAHTLDRPTSDRARRHLAECSACRALAADVVLLQSAIGSPAEGSEPVELVRGATVGRFVVTGRVGGGAMGVVYAAYDPELDRKVALKLLRQDEPSAQQRLKAEAQALAQLSHRNVVTVYEAGEAQGRLFLAMELLAGQTLGQWLAQGQRSREVIDVFLEAGRGLAAAHRAGVVHRDFKPDNVLVGSDGRVCVTDFGLALREQLPAGRPGEVAGTPAYMAPEQLEGTAADARSDQFSYCVALHEALYGQKPFAAADLASLRRAISQGASFTGPLAGGVPSFVQAVLRRGLSERPENRYPDMDALLGELAAGPTRSRRLWRGALGVGGLLAVIAAGVALLLRPGPCAGAHEAWSALWPAPRRAALSKSLEELAPATPALVTAVLERVDGLIAAGAKTSATACRATREMSEAPESLFALRSQCLALQRQELHAQLSLLEKADAKVLDTALQALTLLPAPERCLGVSPLSGKYVVAPEASAVAVRALEEKVAVAKALVRAGKVKEAAEAAPKVLEEARAVGHEPLLVRALVIQGDASLQAGRFKDADRFLWEAAQRAYKTHDDETYAFALSRLVISVGQRQYRVDASSFLEDAAEAAFARSPHAKLDLASFRMTRAMIRFHGGQRDEALALARGAVALGESEEPQGVVTLQLRASLASLLRSLDPSEDLLRLSHEASSGLERLLGPTHPRTLAAQSREGTVLCLLDRCAEALALQEKVLAAQEARQGREHQELVPSLNDLGLTRSRLGDQEGALASFFRARAIAEKNHGPLHATVLTPTLYLGQTHLARRDYRAALETFQKARKVAEKTLDDKNPFYLIILLGEARAQLELGAPLKEIVPLLAKAEVYEVGDSSQKAILRALRGRVALVQGKPNEARAHFLAARELYAKALEKEEVGRMDEHLKRLGGP